MRVRDAWVTYEEFTRSTPADASALSAHLCALMLDKHGDWKAAHETAAASGSAESNRVHAYLHRKEGDMTNARYWYRRVNEPEHTGTLEEEWEMLVKRYL